MRITTIIKTKLKMNINTQSFKCPICGNTDPKYLGIKNGQIYCRKCIAFRGQEAMDDFVQTDNAEYTLRYELSKDQKRLSNQLVDNFKNGIDTLVHAVCGSGKTEICLAIISYCIENKLRVGFAVPRRDVCVELYYRFAEIFNKNDLTYKYTGIGVISYFTKKGTKIGTLDIIYNDEVIMNLEKECDNLIDKIKFLFKKSRVSLILNIPNS